MNVFVFFFTNCARYLVAFTTSWSGLQYIFNKDVVRILHDNKNTNKDSDSKTN